MRLTRSLATPATLPAPAPGFAPRPDVWVARPATLLSQFAQAARGSKLAIGGQDCHAEPLGAFTGDISAEMLKDAGASAVIVGHSERRMYHHETSEAVRVKTLAAWRAAVLAILCLGD